MTLLVVNSNASTAYDLNISLQGLGGAKNFYRYQATPASQDQENVTIDPSAPFAVTSASNTITDSIPANSLAVHSTFRLAAADPAVFADGAYAALPASPLGSESALVDDTAITFGGSWTTEANANYYNGGVHYTKSTAAYAEFTFTGNGFRIYGKRDYGSGFSTVTINGTPASSYGNSYAPVTLYQQVIFDSGPLPTGTYTVRISPNGMVASGATNSDDYLNIDAIGYDVPGFSSWMSKNYPSLTGSAALPGADPDQDGVPNLMEYALAGNPTQSDPGILPVASTSTISGSNYLTLTVQKNPAASGITDTVEVSSDLNTWNSGSGYTTILTNTAASLVVRDNSPISGTRPRFIRLRVTQP